MCVELQTARLRLRAATGADAATLATLAGEPDPEGKRVARSMALVENSRRWCTEFGYGLWVLERLPTEAVIGWCGLRPHEEPQAPELLYGMAPAARGLGLATEAVEAVISWLFSRSDITGLWAVTDPSNTASERLLERVGFDFERRGEFDGLDSLIYRLSAITWRART
jgi:[ribosomal protein S5]-alanine N-acetyltransferase